MKEKEYPNKVKSLKDTISIITSQQTHKSNKQKDGIGTGEPVNTPTTRHYNFEDAETCDNTRAVKHQ